MMQRLIDDVNVSINYSCEKDMRVEEEEIRNYIARSHEKYPHAKLKSLKLDIEGDEVGITYELCAVPFDRIRRITGYLVGSLDRFNDAKRAEESERVKHGVGCGCSI